MGQLRGSGATYIDLSIEPSTISGFWISQQPGAASSSQEQPGAARKQPGAAREQPGAARNSQEQPEAARSSQEQPAAARSSQEQPVITKPKIETMNPNMSIFLGFE